MLREQTFNRMGFKGFPIAETARNALCVFYLLLCLFAVTDLFVIIQRHCVHRALRQTKMVSKEFPQCGLTCPHGSNKDDVCAQSLYLPVASRGPNLKHSDNPLYLCHRRFAIFETLSGIPASASPHAGSFSSRCRAVETAATKARSRPEPTQIQSRRR